MFASLRGSVQHLHEDAVVLDVAGVGYLVHCSKRHLEQLQLQEPTFMLVELQVREDALTLFGFSSAAEQALFRLLTTVQGVGAKLALGMLGSLGAATIEQALANQDAATLTAASGVGKKLAERMVNELKSKIAALPHSSASASTPAGNVNADVLSALQNLGYSRLEASAALQKTDATADFSSMLRGALQQLQSK